MSLEGRLEELPEFLSDLASASAKRATSTLRVANSTSRAAQREQAGVIPDIVMIAESLRETGSLRKINRKLVNGYSESYGAGQRQCLCESKVEALGNPHDG